MTYQILTRRPEEVKPGAVVYRATELEPVEGADDTYEFVASDESVDRYGDIIRADKWQLAAYRKNPVILFGHNNRDPIGMAVKTWVADKQLRVRLKFADAGTSDWIDTLRKLAKQRILRAMSVGFTPTAEPVVRRDEKNDYIIGYEFVGQELLENSIVTVPANPNALAIRGMGVSQEMVERLTAPDAMVQSAVRARSLELLRLGAASRVVHTR